MSCVGRSRCGLFMAAASAVVLLAAAVFAQEKATDAPAPSVPPGAPVSCFAAMKPKPFANVTFDDLVFDWYEAPITEGKGMFNPMYIPFKYVAESGKPDPDQKHVFPHLLSFKFDFVPDNFNARHPFFVFKVDRDFLEELQADPTPRRISDYVQGWRATVAIGGTLIQRNDLYGGSMLVYDGSGGEILRKTYEVRYPYFGLMGQMVRDWMSYREQPISKGLAEELSRPMCRNIAAVRALGKAVHIGRLRKELWPVFEEVLRLAPEFGEVRYWYGNQRRWSGDPGFNGNLEKGRALHDHLVMPALGEFERSACRDPEIVRVFDATLARAVEICPENARVFHVLARYGSPQSARSLKQLDRLRRAAGKYPCYGPLIVEVAWQYRIRNAPESSLPLYLSGTRSTYMSGVTGYSPEWEGMAYAFALLGHYHQARHCALAAMENATTWTKERLLSDLAFSQREHFDFRNARDTYLQLYSLGKDVTSIALAALSAYEAGAPDPGLIKDHEQDLAGTCWWPLILARSDIAAGRYDSAVQRAVSVDPWDRKRPRYLPQDPALIDHRLEMLLVRTDALLLAGKTGEAREEAEKACKVAPHSRRARALLIQSCKADDGYVKQCLDANAFMRDRVDRSVQAATAPDAERAARLEEQAADLLRQAAALGDTERVRFWQGRRPWAAESLSLALARAGRLEPALRLYEAYAWGAQEISDAQDAHTRIFIRKLLLLGGEKERTARRDELDDMPSGPCWHYRACARQLYDAKQYEAALPLLLKVMRVELRPFTGTYYKTGYCYQRCGDHATACGYFRRSAELSPSGPAAYLGLGASLAHLGKYVEAATAFQQCIEADKGQTHFTARSRDLIVRCAREVKQQMLDLGTADKAAEAVQAIVRIHGRDKQLYQILAECYKAAGNEAKAEEYLRLSGSD